MSAECGKGWRARCAASKGAKCTCRCGGANHGKTRTEEAQKSGQHHGIRVARAGGARYRVEEVAIDAVVIRDIGPWDVHKSVTNDAEAVVADLLETYGALRFFYYDSAGALDELLVEDGKFVGFAPGRRQEVTA